MSSDKDAILEEYRNIRSEILQLNSQAFTAVTLFLGVDMTILGWMFSKGNPLEYFYLPVIGFIILFCGCILLLVRDRLAHRLAIFQKLFIEQRLTDIYWAQAYFLYRKEFAENSNFFEEYGERLAGSNLTILVFAQAINVLIFGYCTVIHPLYKYGYDSVEFDGWKVFLFCLMVIICVVQGLAWNRWTKHVNIEKAMRKAADQLLCSNSNKSGKK